MYTVFRVKADELDSRFLESVKALFRDKDIEILVSEVDETTYLLQSEANRQRLLQAIQNVNNQQELVRVQLDVLQ